MSLNNNRRKEPTNLFQYVDSSFTAVQTCKLTQTTFISSFITKPVYALRSYLSDFVPLMPPSAQCHTHCSAVSVVITLERIGRTRVT